MSGLYMAVAQAPYALPVRPEGGPVLDIVPFTAPLFVRNGRALDRGGRVHRLVGYYPDNHPAYRIVTVCELRVCVLDDAGHVLTSRRECDGDLTHVITTPEAHTS